MAGKLGQESLVRFPEMLGALGPSTAFLATGSSAWGSQVALLCSSWSMQLQAVWVQPDMPSIHTHFLDWREGFFAQTPTFFPDSPLLLSQGCVARVLWFPLEYPTCYL